MGVEWNGIEEQRRRRSSIDSWTLTWPDGHLLIRGVREMEDAELRVDAWSLRLRLNC